MRSEGDGGETAGHYGCCTEGSNFHYDLACGWNSEFQQGSNAAEDDAGPGFKEREATACFVFPRGKDKKRRHVDSRQTCRECRAAHAHGGESEMAVNEGPIPCPVNEVCGDEREGDGTDTLHSLQVAAERCVQQQRERAPVEHAQVVRCLLADCRVYAEIRER